MATKQYKEITDEEAGELYLMGIRFEAKYRDTPWGVWGGDVPTTPYDGTFSPMDMNYRIQPRSATKFRVEVE